MTFDISNYLLQEKIGTGSFGKVYKVKEKKSGEIYAAKISLRNIEDYSESIVLDISREVNIIAKLNHPSVLKFIGFSARNFKNKLKPVIITEYSQNGSLYDLIKLARDTNSTTILNDTIKLIIIYGIASAMSYLHSHDIIHRDLKPANILLGDFYFPKIADFGLSKINNSDENNFGIKSTIGAIKGTPKYISPEIWTKTEYKKPGDVYAFAIIVYEIMTNEIPFNNFNLFDIPIKINKGYRPEFKTKIPESYKKLIENCWSQNPNDRPTFDQIVEELKTDQGFITESVNKNDYFNYIQFIDTYKTTYDASSTIIHSNQFFDIASHTFDGINSKKQNENQPNKIIENLNTKCKIFPYKYYFYADANMKKLINKFENDTENYFSTGKAMIQLNNQFLSKAEIGLNFIKQSIKNGNKDAVIYYCDMLIKGNLIPRNLKKAKKLIDKNLSKEDSNYLLINGKIYKKEKNYNDALMCFDESIKRGNINAIYEYGKMLHKGYGIHIYIDEAISFFKKAADSGCAKAMYQYGIELIKQNKNEEGNKYIFQSADNGNLNALYEYSKILEEKYDNKFESEIYLEKAANNGHPEAMYKYGIKLFLKHNFNDALLFLNNAAEKCNIDAIYFSSILLFLQHGLDYNNKKANKLIRIAAINGNIEAMIRYAYILMCYSIKGDDIKEDPINYFQMAAEKGGAKEWNTYALMISSNDPIEAIKYFEMAVEKGNIYAMINYASMLTNGNGFEVNKEKAEELIKMSIKKGIGNDCFEYKNILLNDLEILVNKKDIAQLYKIMIDKGDTQSMVTYAMIILNDNDSLNKEEAIELFKKAIDKGDISALIKYCDVLEKGIGIDVNKEEATKYYKIAIEKGSIDAKVCYAKMILQDNQDEALKLFKSAIDDGWSTDELINYTETIHTDFQKSIKLYKLAAENGNDLGLLNYGILLFNGKGCIENKEEGIKCVKMAADNGLVFAMASYGGLLLYGNNESMLEINDISSALTSVKNLISDNNQKIKDYAEAVKYLKMGAEKNDSFSMANLAKCYLEGIGTEVNKKEAVKIFKKLANKGNQLAVRIYGLAALNGIGTTGNKREGEKYLKKSADDYGDVESMKCLGITYIEGDGIPKNCAEGEKYFKLAIEKGETESMNFYALMHAEGNGIPFNKEEAIKYFQMAIEKGNNNHKNTLDLLLKQGYLISPETEAKVETYKKNIQNGDVDSMLKYGMMLIVNKEFWPLNKMEGVKLIEMAMNKGSEEAMFQYANILFNSIGIDENLDDSIKYYKLAIKKGNPIAMYKYASYLLDGQKIPKNVEKAIKYYNMAIEKGNSDAMFSLASIYYYGNGVEVNKTIALKYYKMASEKGNFEAAQTAGEFYEYGFGTEENLQEAAKYYKIAADGGLPISMCNYGKMLMFGSGVEKNTKEARKYFQKALDSGYALAATFLQLLNLSECFVFNLSGQ